MTTLFERKHLDTKIDPDVRPVITVEGGSVVKVDIGDALVGRYAERVTVANKSRVPLSNRGAGPIAVLGAEPMMMRIERRDIESFGRVRN